MTTSVLEFADIEKNELNSYDFFSSDRARQIIRTIVHDLRSSHKSEDIEFALSTLETLNTTIYYMTVFGFLSHNHYDSLFHRIRSAMHYIRYRYKEVKE